MKHQFFNFRKIQALDPDPWIPIRMKGMQIQNPGMNLTKLFQTYVQVPGRVAHLVELINATNPNVRQDQGARLQHQLPSIRILPTSTLQVSVSDPDPH